MKRLFTALMLLLLSACSWLQPMLLSQEERIKELIDEHRYSEALAIIDQLDNKHPKHQALLQQKDSITQLQSAFIQQVIQEGRYLQQKHQWPSALSKINEARQKNPEHALLDRFYQQLLDNQAAFIANRELRLALQYAQSLPATQSILTELIAANPQHKDYQLIHTQQQAAQKIAIKQLQKQLDIAIQRPDWQAVNQYVNALQRLDSHLSLTHYTAQLAKQQRQHQKLAEQKKLQQLSSLQTAIQHEHWHEAQLIADTLSTWYEKDTNVAKTINTLQQRVMQHVSWLIGQGQRYYTQGDLQQAISRWRQALILSPNNKDIQDRLQRAIRFKNNVERLQ